MVIEIVKAPRRKPDGKMIGGTKAKICVACLARGTITELISS
jgi:hypothetical protein